MFHLTRNNYKSYNKSIWKNNLILRDKRKRVPKEQNKDPKQREGQKQRRKKSLILSVVPKMAS